MSRTLRTSVVLQLCLVFGALAAVFVLYFQTADAAVTQTVRRDLPIALDGEVWATQQVGNAVVVAGNFTQVQVERNGAVIDQVGIYAYDIDSGELIEGFRPTLSSSTGIVEIRDLAPTPDGQSVYVAGRFTSINDGSDGRNRVRNRLALLRISDGQVDRSFANAGVNAQVNSIALGPDGNLYAGGNFDTVFDLAPNRPPATRAVGFLARFDSRTGTYDPSFRIESRIPIGNRGIGGVARVGFRPDSSELVVAHRGAEIFDAVRGVSHDAAGLAVVDTATNTPTNFRALYPVVDDPIQSFYHADQCRSLGVQIRDIDVQSNFVVLVHQGGDRGVQCDTVVRFPLADAAVRPDWVSRAFDSVFSVEVDGDDIYIGGHFRYLVSSNAPTPFGTPYPANGERLPDRVQWYVADGVQELFVQDFVDTGYAFPVGQLGLLDATTGFADPTFVPQSDALLGVLDLTAIDRGLLLGQDGGRINGVLTGRAAFFDNDPNAASPQCRVRPNGDGVPVVSWSEVDGVNEWNVARNGDWITNVSGDTTSITDENSGFGQTEYELRYSRNGQRLVETCGAIDIATPALSCSAVVDGDTATVTWTNAGYTRVAVFADGNWQANVTTGNTYSAPVEIGDTSFAIRAFSGPDRLDDTCGTVTVAPPPPPAPPSLECSVSGAGNQVTVTWTDNAYARVGVFANNAWVANIRAGNSYDTTLEPGDTTFTIRAFRAGQRTDAVCGTATLAAPAPAPVQAGLSCSVARDGGNVTVSWNDVGAGTYQVRTNDRWLATASAGETAITIPDSAADYTIRYRIAGQRFDVDCA